jgi:hypothetical protein
LLTLGAGSKQPLAHRGFSDGIDGLRSGRDSPHFGVFASIRHGVAGRTRCLFAEPPTRALRQLGIDERELRAQRFVICVGSMCQ